MSFCSLPLTQLNLRKQSSATCESLAKLEVRDSVYLVGYADASLSKRFVLFFVKLDGFAVSFYSVL